MSYYQPPIPSTGGVPSTYPQQNYPPGPPQPGYPSGNLFQPTGYPPQQNIMDGNYPSPGGYQNQGYPTSGGGVPQPPICPSAPDLSQMQKIPGYEGLTFEDAILPPPVVPAWQPDNQQQRPLQNLPVLKEEDAREAVGQYSSEHCCYSSKVGREMAVNEIMMISAFHYKLESFCERRESAWRFEPFNGQPIDGPSNGLAPNPWDVPAVPPQYFKDLKVKCEVPHTAFVKPCHTCVGNARVRCDTCMGNGRKQCTWCNGRGRRNNFDRDELCSSCNGMGYQNCFHCSGTGQVKCKTCEGKGNLKGFVELTITWTNYTDNFISETSNMPKELVLQVTGQVAYEEENPRVFPITQSSQQAVSRASTELINKHSTAFTNERILKQRQCLRVIPIGQVRYEWKDKLDEFYVYGFEHKVYFKKYPQKCGCVIM